nr:hypothetical protein [Tanacetum cinerariifolium]
MSLDLAFKHSLQSRVRSCLVLTVSWDDMKLKDNIVVAMPKLVGEGFYTCNVSINTSITSILEKIDKMEILIIDGKVFLVDDEGKPLTKVVSSGDHDSEDEIASVANDMSNFLASKKDDYGTNSLLEQWKESYVNGDYDYDPYDDDMYEGQDSRYMR